MPTVKFHLKNARKNGQLRTDEVPIRAIFTLDRIRRFEVRPEEKVQPRYWDSKAQCVKPSHRYHIEINNNLYDFRRDLLNLWKENRKLLSFDEFKLLANQHTNPVKNKSIFEVYDKFLQQYKAEKDVKTYQKYAQVNDLLKAYDAIRPFDLGTMDLNFYDNFRSFLYSQPNRQYIGHQLIQDGEYYTIEPGKGMPVPLMDGTVYKLLSNLKNFLKWAEDRGNVVHQSYKKWTIKRYDAKPISLTLAELERLEGAILPQHLSIARDYLVFECRTGQRISDIKRLDLSQFANNTWTFNRKKGNRISSKQVVVHFEGYCAPALNILERYNFKMPSVSEPKLNKNIKEACKIAGVNTPTTTYQYSGSKCIRTSEPKYKFISTHNGRKTFISLALQFMSPKIVKDLTGISDYKTLKHYEGDSEAGIIKQQLNQMQDKIKSA